MAKTKEEHYMEVITNMLNRELEDLKKITQEVEHILNAELMNVEDKAIQVMESMQRVKFNAEIFRELRQMRR